MKQLVDVWYKILAKNNFGVTVYRKTILTSIKFNYLLIKGVLEKYMSGNFINNSSHLYAKIV